MSDQRIFSIKLYSGEFSEKTRSRAILFTDLTEDGAIAKYEEINRAFGHPADDDSVVVTSPAGLPYVLIDF